MKKYTNEELCYLISKPCNNTAKAEYFKRIKFTSECLAHKFVLHVPAKNLVNDKMVDAECDKFIDVVVKSLGINSFYITQAFGVYNGMMYSEWLVTAFVNNELVERIDDSFRHAIVKCHLDMQQESYAYELDDKLNVVRFES